MGGFKYYGMDSVGWDAIPSGAERFYQGFLKYYRMNLLGRDAIPSGGNRSAGASFRVFPAIDSHHKWIQQNHKWKCMFLGTSDKNFQLSSCDIRLVSKEISLYGPIMKGLLHCSYQ